MGADVIAIVEPGVASATWLALGAACARDLGAGALVIGTAPEARRARAAGFRVLGQCALPLGSATLGWRSMRARWAPLLRGRAAFCLSPLAGAVGASCAARSCVLAGFSPAARTPVASSATAWLGSGAPAARLVARAARGPRSVDVIPAEPRAAAAWPGAGTWRLQAPWIALPERGEAPLARADVRRAWGVPDDALVVGLVGGPPAAADAMQALDIVGRVALQGVRTVLVLPPGAARAGVAVRWARQMPHVGAVVVADAMADPWRVSAALDAGLVAPADGVAGDCLDALHLARLGLPIVAPMGSAPHAWGAVLEDRAYAARRFTAAARALRAVALAGAAARHEQPLVVPPGPAALAERVRALLGTQRAAA